MKERDSLPGTRKDIFFAAMVILMPRPIQRHTQYWNISSRG